MLFTRALKLGHLWQNEVSLHKVIQVTQKKELEVYSNDDTTNFIPLAYE